MSRVRDLTDFFTNSIDLTTSDVNYTADKITLSGPLVGPSVFTIDPAAEGDNTGTLIIAGNLQVDGTTTTINSTTLSVDDLNITIASGAANAAAANGAGLTVEGANATLTYVAASDSFVFNKNIDVPGLTATTADINSGTIDGTVIGGTTPAAITGTTGSFSGNVGLGTTDFAVGKLAVDGDISINAATAGRFTWNRNGEYLNWIESDGVAGNNFVRFGVGNSEAVRITSSGSVGIGTSSPSEKLTVLGNAVIGGVTTPLGGALSVWSSANGTVAAFRNGGAGTQRGLYVGVNNTTGDVSLDATGSSGGNLVFATGSGERMRIDASSGNVGIGATNPSSALTVFSNDVMVAEFLSLDASNVGEIALRSAGGVGANYRGRIVGGYDAGGSGYGGFLAFKTTTTQNINNEHMRITQGGNVGIGTTAPAAKLHIAGSSGGATSFAAIQIDNASVGGGRIDFRNSAANPIASIDVITEDINSGTFNDGVITFKTSADASSFERMRITSRGNVGIGTTSPVAGLHINTGTRSLSLASPSSGGGGASYIIMGNNDSGGTAGPNVIISANRNLLFGVGDSFSSNTGGTFTEYMRFDPDGRVLLGSTFAAPGLDSGTLQVGTGFSALTNTGSALAPTIVTSGSLEFNFDGVSGTQRHGRIVGTAGNGAGGPYSGGLNFEYYAYNGVSAYQWYTGLTLDALGRVGIGTTSPSEKLDIDGNAKMRTGGVLYVENPAGGRLGALGTDSEGTFLTSFNGFGEPLTLNAPASTARMSFRVAGDERMRIDNAGRVTTPSQPYAVIQFTNANSDVGSSSNRVNGSVLRPSVVIANVGNIYNQSNGRFTAPVTGVYDVGFSSNIAVGNASTWINVVIFRNGGTHKRFYSDKVSPSWQLFSGSTYIPMNQNDYVEFILFCASGDAGFDGDAYYSDLFFRLVG